jgi:hypothetical protein
MKQDNMALIDLRQTGLRLPPGAIESVWRRAKAHKRYEFRVKVSFATRSGSAPQDFTDPFGERVAVLDAQPDLPSFRCRLDR